MSNNNGVHKRIRVHCISEKNMFKKYVGVPTTSVHNYITFRTVKDFPLSSTLNLLKSAYFI